MRIRLWIVTLGATGALIQELAQLDVNGEAVERRIHELIQHKVAVTSTLAVFEVAPRSSRDSSKRSHLRQLCFI